MAGIAHSSVDETCGWQVNLCDPLLTRAISERLSDESHIYSTMQIYSFTCLLINMSFLSVVCTLTLNILRFGIWEI